MTRIAHLTKTLLAVVLVIAGFPLAHAQNEFECKCAEIGIDSAWTAQNKIVCYKIPVPQIYTHATTGTKHLAVIRASATTNTTQPPLLYLHGGPGISTLDNARRYLSDPDWAFVRKKRDIVIMDYSGTGYSEPRLCESLLDSINNVKRSSLPEAHKKQKERQFTLKCRESLSQNNIDINTFSSVQLAADANAVRDALGISHWQIYGVSYGTLVALMSLRHFPNHINGVVLDSPMPPNAPGFDFASTMSETLENLQNQIARDPELLKLFPDITADFAKTCERLNQQPLDLNGYPFTGDDFAWAMVMTFYKTASVPYIPLALKEFASGNYALLAKWLGTLHSENQHGKPNDFQNKAITCYECKPKTHEQTPGALEQKYPHLKSLSGREFMELCAVFRPENPPASFYEPVQSNIPVLVLSGAFDPGTPPSFARATVEKLTRATLVIVPNASHAAMHYNKCTLELVDAFLQNPEARLQTDCINKIPKIMFATSDLAAALDKQLKPN